MALTLLPELWLSLLNRAEDHVSRRGSGQAVKTSTGAVGLDDEEGLGAAVVSAVEDGTGGQTEGHAVLVARGTDNCESHSARKFMTSPWFYTENWEVYEPRGYGHGPSAFLHGKDVGSGLLTAFSGHFC